MINELLGGSGCDYPIRLGDKTFQLAPLTQEVKGRFENHMKARAAQLLELLPPGRYTEGLSQLQKDVASGVYSFHGPLCLEAMKTQGGALIMLASLLDCTEGEAVEILTTQHEKVMALMNLRIEEARPRGNVKRG